MSDYASGESSDILLSRHQPEAVTLKGYIIGFASSLVLTMIAYLLVRYGSLNKSVLVVVLSLLALIQFGVQLIYFLHVGREFTPRLKLMIMLFMFAIVFIIVGGSIWIMNNIDGRMMNPKQMVHYMNNQDNL